MLYTFYPTFPIVIQDKQKKKNVNNFDNLRSRSSNLTIKMTDKDRERSEVNKEIKSVKNKINSLEKVQKSVLFKRDDYNSKVRDHQQKQTENRETRDEINAKVAEMKKVKNEKLNEKNVLISKKRKLGEQLQEEPDRAKRDTIYKEFNATRETLTKLFEELDEIFKEYNALRDEGQNAHENMLTYGMMADQSRKEGDEHHKQYKKIGNTIYKMRKKIRSLEVKLKFEIK